MLIENDRLIQALKQKSSKRSYKEKFGPIEQEMRKRIDSLKGCQYRDTFDWSIYDKVAYRFGLEQPRGGVVFKTTFKVVNYHTSCFKCHYAFELDSYGRGCIHNCSYCYAKDLLTTHGFWNRPIPFPVDLSRIRKVFYDVFETDRKSKWRQIMQKRIPLRIGSMSDSFMWMDQKHKVTQELLKILKFYNYPYIIFTRSDLVAHDDYIRLMDKNLASIQMSISGNNEKLIKLIEPGAPSVLRRYTALKKLSKHGFWTTVRINPMFPIFPDGYFSDLKSIKERFGSKSKCSKLEIMNWDFPSEIAETGTKSLLAGFVRLSPAAIKRMSKVLKINLSEFFKPELYRLNGDKRFSDLEIYEYYRKMRSECEKYNIRFNTCYIGNGAKDYFQYQDLWSNRDDCCDAKGNVHSFKSSSQEIPWSERSKHSSCKDTVYASKKLEEKFDKIFLKAERATKSNIEKFRRREELWSQHP